MSVHGIGLVARQELRTRLRTGRWRVLMGVWFALVNGLALLFRISLEAGDTSSFGELGIPMFGGVLLGVLVLTLMVVPALGAQSINGDRERGTLAVLQTTRLTPLDITLGKFAAAWGTGLVVLAFTLPSVLWPVLEGAIGIGRAVVVLTVVALLIGVICAISLGWSALMVRSITSVLMSYLTVFFLLVCTPLLFGISLAFTEDDSARYSRSQPEQVWWMLAPNPVVILADAAPRLDERIVVRGDYTYTESPDDPLGDIGREVRKTRSGRSSYSYSRYKDEAGPVWPYGLAFNLLLAGGALFIASRRLRTPAHTIPKGVRLA
ncbi:ABC transporter permease [Spirillospora sp. CA-294931]|uniref:ABC transporter permease n=1 Tax=Spirillospora sp. CA-294931 TaxID=3240042 RepID=UPI003D8C72E1